ERRRPRRHRHRGRQARLHLAPPVPAAGGAPGDQRGVALDEYEYSTEKPASRRASSCQSRWRMPTTALLLTGRSAKCSRMGESVPVSTSNTDGSQTSFIAKLSTAAPSRRMSNPKGGRP